MDRSSTECNSGLQLLRRLCRACNLEMIWTESKTYVSIPDETQPKSLRNEVLMNLKCENGEIPRLIHEGGLPFTVEEFGETLEDTAKRFLEKFLSSGNDLVTRCPEWKCKRDFLLLEDGSALTMESLDMMLSLRGF